MLANRLLERPTAVEPDGFEAAAARFARRFPQFDPGGTFAALRRGEYGRLDDEGAVYLDYTGGSLYATSQLDAHVELLRRRVLGNPHSASPASLASTASVAAARQATRTFFNAPEEDYLCVFTPNASGALRLVGEAYRFEPDGTFALTVDNHNSVNGIREFARRKGARTVYLPIEAAGLRVDRTAMSRTLGAARPGRRNLLAFPAQSNYSGVQHPLDLVSEAHAAGWDVLLDAAAFAPTNRLDLARVRPDFVSISFYKIFGYPTGIGCLLVRRDRIHTLARPWFAGGTVTVASVLGDGHYLCGDEAAFEDGTVDYLSLPAVRIGLQHISNVGLDAIHQRVTCLTTWLLETLCALRHPNGRRLVRIFGPEDGADRGGTVAFALLDSEGRRIDERRLETLAGRAGISLRTGCFCNPGAGEVAHGLTADEMRPYFGLGTTLAYADLRDELLLAHSRSVGAIRVSLGVASNFADVYRFAGFLQRFVQGGPPCSP
jgi:molybdenum cofactor sulfurtransferase